MVSAYIGDISFDRFLLFIFAIVATFILGGIANVVISRAFKEKVSRKVYKPLAKIAMYAVYAAGIAFAFNKIIQFNVPAGLAALGVLGIAMLLPAVPILQGIVAGLVVALERPFKEDDVIQFEGELCRVRDIGLRKTKLRSFSGKVITVPNIVFVTAAPVINYSSGEFIKITQTVDVAAGSDIKAVRGIVGKICTSNPNILPNVPQRNMKGIIKLLELPRTFLASPKRLDSLKPRVSIKSVSKEKISLLVVFWTWDITLQEQIVNEFYEKLIKEFSKAGIKLG